MALHGGKWADYGGGGRLGLSEYGRGGSGLGRRRRRSVGVSVATAAESLLAVTVPKCQVKGCHVSLVNAKDYHRRHKVCEIHSKALKVMVSGLEQRFCQHCSRFHVVSEFEESKRSCKRRLAGHNERRRKSSHDSIARHSSHHENNIVVGGGFPYIWQLPRSDVLSLFCHLRPPIIRVPPSESDLSSRSSAALRELIAENRATIMAPQLVVDGDAWPSHHAHHHPPRDQLFGSEAPRAFGSMESHHHHNIFPEPHHNGGWERIGENGMHVTLHLMQAPSQGFGAFMASTGKTKTEEDDCSDHHLWNFLQGHNLV
ncbi:hypothetical protein CsatB_003386 [Cannabis sativa]|nr:squamosa promoter-binding-like protein 7 [Cannabis sativa]